MGSIAHRRYDPATGGGSAQTSIRSASGGKVRPRPPSLPLSVYGSNADVSHRPRRLTHPGRTQDVYVDGEATRSGTSEGDVAELGYLVVERR